VRNTKKHIVIVKFGGWVNFYRFFPSSKTCSNCGWIKQDLTLSIREWTCESCGEHHHRDVNAAKNILKQGINILSGCGMQSDTKQKQGEALPLGESVTLEAQPIGSAVGG
jgi:putative transposase